MLEFNYVWLNLKSSFGELYRSWIFKGLQYISPDCLLDMCPVLAARSSV